MSMLFAARALEGCAGAAIQTAGTALLKGYYTTEQEDRPMALIFLVMSVGGLLGPPFGGIAHHFGGWSYPFLFMTGIALLVTLSAMCFVTETEERPAAVPVEHLFQKQIVGIL